MKRTSKHLPDFDRTVKTAGTPADDAGTSTRPSKSQIPETSGVTPREEVAGTSTRPSTSQILQTSGVSSGEEVGTLPADEAGTSTRLSTSQIPKHLELHQGRRSLVPPPGRLQVRFSKLLELHQRRRSALCLLMKLVRPHGCLQVRSPKHLELHQGRRLVSLSLLMMFLPGRLQATPLEYQKTHPLRKYLIGLFRMSLGDLVTIGRILRINSTAHMQTSQPMRPTTQEMSPVKKSRCL
ncbi:uncharacterized protein LOC119735585 [Patiria miniata]|uniref:Uncharacterized protein n=1 Tax=Patiria miniata TaxID=46514 RepID=A0A914AP69_PATMI|nr:uncharacterized protein LOC119735585 [Patiria miniata]